MNENNFMEDINYIFTWIWITKLHFIYSIVNQYFATFIYLWVSIVKWLEMTFVNNLLFFEFKKRVVTLFSFVKRNT